MKRIAKMFAALVVPFCLSAPANAGPADFLSGFLAADPKVKAAYCVLAIGSKVSDMSKGAAEHGGLGEAAAEAVWEKIDMYEMRGLIFYRLLHLLGESDALSAEKAAQDAFVETGVADYAKAQTQQLTVADLCAVEGFNAVAASDLRVKGMEAGFREALKKDRAEVKADFIRRATAPYHD